LLKQNYLASKRPNEKATFIGSSRPQEPYYLKEVLVKNAKLPLAKIEKFFEIFSTNYIELPRSRVNLFIEVENKFFLIYPHAFAYDTFRIMEEYILEKISATEINKYYKLRGDFFEKYCESSISYHFERTPHKKLKYKFNNKLQEIDLLIEYPDAYIVVECKSSKFIDCNEFYPIKDILNDIKKSVGKGFKTLNTFMKYSDSSSELVFMNGDTQLIFPKKKIYPIVLTLSDLKFVAGTIQKYEQLEKIAYYPVSLSIMDFNTILKNAPDKRFLLYLNRRLDLINNFQNATFDIDEIDVYGFIMYEDFEKLKSIMTISKDIDFSFMISNSVYRKQANDETDQIFFNYLIQTYHPEYCKPIKKTSRNAFCLCNSGMKYKQCCGK